MTGDQTLSVPLFTSRRERRLWAWTLAVVVAIYSTLGLARTLADVLSETGLDAITYLLGAFMIAAAVVAQALRRPLAGAEIFVVLGVAAVYLLVFTRMVSPVERSHLIEYGVVALLIYAALDERASQGRPVPRPALLAVLATALIGVIDELIQAVLPTRVFDPIDIGFNTVAAVMAVAASLALGWARRRRRSRTR